MKTKKVKAFPGKETRFKEVGNTEVKIEDYYQGMDLRDYFAIKILQGILSMNTPMISRPNYYTQSAYEMADEMLKQREL